MTEGSFYVGQSLFVQYMDDHTIYNLSAANKRRRRGSCWKNLCSKCFNWLPPKKKSLEARSGFSGLDAKTIFRTIIQLLVILVHLYTCILRRIDKITCSITVFSSLIWSGNTTMLFQVITDRTWTLCGTPEYLVSIGFLNI